MIDPVPPARPSARTPEHPHQLTPDASEATLFRAKDVLVTSERLVAHGRTWQLGDIMRVNAVHRAPRVLPLLATLGLGVVLGLPALLSAMANTDSQGKGFYEAVLVVACMIIFGSIARLLLVEDTYWLVLRTPQSERRVFSSRDHQLVTHLATVIAEAAAVARQRR